MPQDSGIAEETPHRFQTSCERNVGQEKDQGAGNPREFAETNAVGQRKENRPLWAAG